MRRLAAIVLSGLTLTACGASEEDTDTKFKGEEARVAGAVEDLQEAGSERDANKICEQLVARELLARIRQTGGEDCIGSMEDVLNDADTFELRVKDVTVNGTSATAVVESENGDKDRRDTLRLVKERNAWRVASLGG